MARRNSDTPETAVASGEQARVDVLPAAPLDSIEVASGLLRSTIWNWAGEFVMVVSGFVLPRLINQRMSQEELGIWDFGWSIRSYVALAFGPLGTGANHYFARYASSEQWPEISRTLGAMLALVMYASLGAGLFTLGLAYFTPRLVNTASILLIGDARSLVLSMGLTSCISILAVVFGGIIAGRERFDVLNLIDGFSDVLLVVAVLASVLSGAGLKVMGFCVLARELLNGLAKYWCAGKIAPQVSIRPRWVDRSMFREIFGYSAKTMMHICADLLQITPLVVVTVIGPAALALYSRPRALIQVTTRFLMAFTRVLVPVASAFHGKQDRQELGELLVRSTRYVMFLALPPVLVMLILGQALLRVWMGDRSYADNHVLLILVLGYLPLFAQQATSFILFGLASHGLTGAASLSGSLLGAGLSILFVGMLGWGIDGAALAAAIPIFVVNLCVLPYAGCRAVHIPLLRYVRDSIVSPLFSVIPFAAVLLTVRLSFPGKPTAQLLVGLFAGSLVLAPVYWHTLVPVDLKQRISRRFLL
ncbi:MAG: lipopolysaccharide biosynthesis protein [Candidatus Rokubacteria bacterium]|nr:lipopolysaccharide biosynthesis protein [Candidatus Rokubacteria bacterium]